MRPCKSIGMHAIDRSIRASCAHRSEFCASRCYNEKLFNLYPNMIGADDRLEREWSQLTGESVAREFGRKRSLSPSRLRLMTRGEALATPRDVGRVRDIALAMPGTLVWIPTRAWRNRELERVVRHYLQPIPNLKLMASTDPTTTPEQDRALESLGWSTMYFGDDERTTTPSGRSMLRCPKTWSGLSGHCAICKAGCFRSRRVDIHLKEH